MKKLTAGIFATLLTMVSVDGAYAAIASKGYVDEKVGTVTTELGNKADKTAIADMLTKTEAGTTYATKESIADMETKSNASATYATKSEVSSLSSEAEKIANRVTTVSDASDNTHYPTAKAVWDVVQAETSDIASSGDLSALTTRVSTAEGEIDTLQTDMAGKANTADLGDLATLNAVGSAEITDGAVATADIADKAVTEAKLSDTVNASLDKADTALQATDLADYVTKEAADAAYADIATEGVASTASTSAQTALTNIGTLSQLTTDAKGNTVAAINEVAKEAADAQSTATGAQSAVDAVESTIGGYGDIVTHNASEFATTTALTSGLAGKLDTDGTAARATADASGNEITATYATKAEIADLATDENLELKQDKTDEGLKTTDKTVVGAINEVKTTADGANTAAGAAQSAAEAAQEDATQALADAATAQRAAEAAQATADAKQDKLTGTIGGSMQPVYSDEF